MHALSIIDEGVDPAWAECRFLTCSILPVRMACNCDCAFCFSKSSVSVLGRERWEPSDAAVDRFLQWSKARGATRLVITGGGEPLLRPELCVALVARGRQVFDEVALFTNGSRLDAHLTKALVDAGLSYVCWSRHHYDDAANRAIMGNDAPSLDAFVERAGGLTIRATCVMTQGGIEHDDDVWAYIDRLREHGITQFTFKHTYVAYTRSVFGESRQNAWAHERRVDRDPFIGQGKVIGRLPWGPEIRRVEELQLCHYREPTPDWERMHRLARSTNLLSDGSVYASLEDPPEPVVPVDVLNRALTSDEQIERFRPLLPVGYTAVARAYREAVDAVQVNDLSGHYRAGLDAFESRLVPRVKSVLHTLSGGAWSLEPFVAFAAGSDVDLMTHVVNAVAAESDVALYPGDWWGFRVGSPHTARIRWDADRPAAPRVPVRTVRTKRPPDRRHGPVPGHVDAHAAEPQPLPDDGARRTARRRRTPRAAAGPNDPVDQFQPGVRHDRIPARRRPRAPEPPAVSAVRNGVALADVLSQRRGCPSLRARRSGRGRRRRQSAPCVGARLVDQPQSARSRQRQLLREGLSD